MAAWTLSSSGASAASSRASVVSAVFAAAALLAILDLSSPQTQKKTVRNASRHPHPSSSDRHPRNRRRQMQGVPPVPSLTRSSLRSSYLRLRGPPEEL